jgi:hypothetical protein
VRHVQAVCTALSLSGVQQAFAVQQETTVTKAEANREVAGRNVKSHDGTAASIVVNTSTR